MPGTSPIPGSYLPPYRGWNRASTPMWCRGQAHKALCKSCPPQQEATVSTLPNSATRKWAWKPQWGNLQNWKNISRKECPTIKSDFDLCWLPIMAALLTLSTPSTSLPSTARIPKCGTAMWKKHLNGNRMSITTTTRCAATATSGAPKQWTMFIR